VEQRFTFDKVADLYDAARPGYPDALMDHVVTFAGLEMSGSKIRFMEAGLHRFDGRYFRTSAHLTRAILHQIVGCSPTGKEEQFKSA
jgi:hypothetical protein